jgi:hypothetical protein
LFAAQILGGRHPGVDALVHLARYRRAHIRSVGDWSGSSSSWRAAVCSLAHHLICEYKVPAFLASCWYANGSAADRKRGWFLAHSRGASFRSLDLPMAMTRRMEHIFLASQDHLPVEHAMRMAELLALGAPGGLLKAILSTPLAADLRDSEFWRSAWMFFIAHADELNSAQIGPMIDFIQALRQDRLQNEETDFGSARPVFSMKGRTLNSMLRMMKEWHRSLGAGGACFSWARSPFQPLQFDESGRDGSEPPRRWQMIELINSAQLRSEGTALHHCVASYADRCYRGVSSIWSLRFRQAERIHHVLTVEVDPRRRAVVQARARSNRAAAGKPLRYIEEWAVREKLQMLGELQNR